MLHFVVSLFIVCKYLSQFSYSSCLVLLCGEIMGWERWVYKGLVTTYQTRSGIQYTVLFLFHFYFHKNNWSDRFQNIFFFSVRTGALYEMQSKCVPYITSSIQYLFRFFVFLFFFIPSLICGVMTKTRVGDQTSHFLCSLPRLVWSVHRAVTLEHSLTGNGGFTCLVGLVDEVCFLYEGIGL